MNSILAVAIGSALGGVSRYWVGAAVDRLLRQGFPWGTVVVNVSGALLAGVLAALFVGSSIDATVHLLLLVGFCGSYTSVSAFALQTFSLAREGNPLWALTNVATSLLLCLAAAGLGLQVGSSLAAGGG